MTAEEKSTKAEDMKPDEGAMHVEEIDWLLQSLVDEANALNGEFLGITLNIQGTMVSGILLGASQYFKELAQVFSWEGEEPKEGTWAKLMLDQAKYFTVEKGEEIQINATYIHLKDARVHANGQRAVPSNEGVLWRGKLSAVSGWWIGRLRFTTDS